jgi:hypothetical protein
LSYAAVIDWYGPYHSVAGARASARDLGFGETIYVAIGSVGRQSTPKLQYVGITKDFPTRPNTAHPIRRRIQEDGLSLYLGDVASQGVSGRRPAHHSKTHSSLLDLAEDAIAFLLELPLNRDKRCARPKDSIIIVNRWWHDDDRRKHRRPHPDWPDLLEYDDHSDFASICWHGGVRRRLNGAALDALCVRGKRALKRARAADAN